MPLGLPSHLATRTTSTAVARAAHAAAAVCLGGVGVVALSVQAYLPQLVVWPALAVLVPMVALLVLLSRSPSVFVATSYLIIGGLCVIWYTLIVSRQLDTPVANDDYTIVLLKLALLLVVGPGASFVRAMLWTSAGFAVGELASYVALLWLGSPWRFDLTTLVVWFIVMVLLAVLYVDRLAARDTQAELNRAARDEMLADVKRAFEARATALLHDTVLNQLAAITATHGALTPAARVDITTTLEEIVGHEWFEGDGAVQPSTPRLAALATALDDVSAGALTVSLEGDREALDEVSPEVFQELQRAVAQCVDNVRRHAQIDAVQVVIGSTADDLSIMVIDAGRGFDPGAVGDERLGVSTSVVARLHSVGGSAVVWSQPEQGTSVLLRVPLARSMRRGGVS